MICICIMPFVQYQYHKCANFSFANLETYQWQKHESVTRVYTPCIPSTCLATVGIYNLLQMYHINVYGILLPYLKIEISAKISLILFLNAVIHIQSFFSYIYQDIPTYLKSSKEKVPKYFYNR